MPVLLPKYLATEGLIENFLLRKASTTGVFTHSLPSCNFKAPKILFNKGGSGSHYLLPQKHLDTPEMLINYNLASNYKLILQCFP